MITPFYLLCETKCHHPTRPQDHRAFVMPGDLGTKRDRKSKRARPGFGRDFAPPIFLNPGAKRAVRARAKSEGLLTPAPVQPAKRSAVQAKFLGPRLRL